MCVIPLKLVFSVQCYLHEQVTFFTWKEQEFFLACIQLSIKILFSSKRQVLKVNGMPFNADERPGVANTALQQRLQLQALNSGLVGLSILIRHLNKKYSQQLLRSVLCQISCSVPWVQNLL